MQWKIPFLIKGFKGLFIISEAGEINLKVSFVIISLYTICSLFNIGLVDDQFWYR